MKFLWITDPHCDALNGGMSELLDLVSHTDSTVLLTGDISSSSTVDSLDDIRRSASGQAYFVLGNHDYYGTSFGARRATIRDYVSNDHFKYLTLGAAVEYEDGKFICGADCWCDCGYGDVNASNVAIRDFHEIMNFSGMDKNHIVSNCRRFAKNDVDLLFTQISDALKESPKRILVLTHIPPFAGNVISNGVMADSNHLPWFACKMLGDMLYRLADENQNVEFKVLCGHAHSSAVVTPLKNLTVNTGHAEYGVVRYETFEF